MFVSDLYLMCSKIMVTLKLNASVKELFSFKVSVHLHSEPEKTWQYIFDYNFGYS